MSNINALSTMQKKAIHTVALENYNAHTEPIFKNLRILPLSKLILFFNLQIMQQFKQGFYLLPSIKPGLIIEFVEVTNSKFLLETKIFLKFLLQDCRLLSNCHLLIYQKHGRILIMNLLK